MKIGMQCIQKSNEVQSEIQKKNLEFHSAVQCKKQLQCRQKANEVQTEIQ